MEAAKKLVTKTFGDSIAAIPGFKVLDEKLVPFGLKPHTRSISWLAEQVAVQAIKRQQVALKLSEVELPAGDLTVWDIKIASPIMENIPVYINYKVTNENAPRRRNDIASVKALLWFYDNHPDALLMYYVQPLRFKDVQVSFVGAPDRAPLPLDEGFRCQQAQ